MVGEEGYKALERGDLITAYNEFSRAESNAESPVERSMMMINEGALLIAFGKLSMAVEKLIRAKSILSGIDSEKKMLAVACLNLSKALLMVNRVESAESEARCAERLLSPDDPHLLYVKALIKFYRNDVKGLLEIKLDSIPEPYRGMIRVLQLRANSDENYLDDLQKLIPSAGIREALGLV